MFGRFYTVTVQAINKRQKMSLLSEPAIFEVKAVSVNTLSSKNSSASNGAAVPLIDTAIKGMSAIEANANQITLEWPDRANARDYKLYWDQGSQDDLNILSVLAMSTNHQNKFVVDHKTSGSILGSEYVRTNGGTFKFRVSYLSKESGKESEISQVLKVNVSPIYKAQSSNTAHASSNSTGSASHSSTSPTNHK
mmetsp:Transcript_11888/g.20107  ORF Transcript_11888/g.20107 Transcript_11888/m.20107 type:complete len:194 (+) Transcript_11888:1509-2090(+)